MVSGRRRHHRQGSRGPARARGRSQFRRLQPTARGSSRHPATRPPASGTRRQGAEIAVLRGMRTKCLPPHSARAGHRSSRRQRTRPPEFGMPRANSSRSCAGTRIKCSRPLSAPMDCTISLAFLAPNLVKAAVEGRLPRGIGVERLRDLRDPNGACKLKASESIWNSR